MPYADRSLSACLRCRKQKLKCGGPSRIPCQRCIASNAECIFVAPKTAQVRSTGSKEKHGVLSPADKIAQLEARLSLVEEELRAEIRELRRENAGSSRNDNTAYGDSGATAAASDGAELLRPASISQSSAIAVPRTIAASDDALDLVSKGLISEAEWNELFSFYYQDCRAVVGFLDDRVCPPAHVLRHHPLMSAVVCTIASRAIKPELHRSLVSHTDFLVMNTFRGPPSDFYSVVAMAAFIAWTGTSRLLSYAVSVAGELKLHEAALRLLDAPSSLTESNVEHGRTWLTLCCLDLQINLSQPFAIDRVKEYVPCANALLRSPFRRPVDYRICTYFEGFVIAVDVKNALKSSQLQVRPLQPEVAARLATFDERADKWFHEIDRKVESHYQAFGEHQDRTRYIIPYTYMKIYINGLALHGVDSHPTGPFDKARLAFTEKALDSANLLIETKYESPTFRRQFRYAIDYNGRALYQASNFMLKALAVIYQELDCTKYLASLRKASQIFEESGAIEAASDIKRQHEHLAVLMQTPLYADTDLEFIDNNLGAGDLFDIPSFFRWSDIIQ
ncbi:hypothetical protein BX600DRAFT_32921 [Xylariales sp. PMI_506]|nr:hypothetical protein BX600DRAFT_32921 [Xylariales sp. PMI_506]